MANLTATNLTAEYTNPMCFGGFEGFDCSILWVIIIMLFFFAAVFRRQVADALLDMDFHLISSIVLAEVLYILMIFITHNMKLAAIVGLAGMILGGFIGAKFFGGEEEV